MLSPDCFVRVKRFCCTDVIIVSHQSRAMRHVEGMIPWLSCVSGGLFSAKMTLLPCVPLHAVISIFLFGVFLGVFILFLWLFTVQLSHCCGCVPFPNTACCMLADRLFVLCLFYRKKRKQKEQTSSTQLCIFLPCLS